MSLPRHFSQRPRTRLAPPPQRGVADFPAPVVETVESVAEAIAEVIEAAPVVVEPVAPAWNVTMKKADLLSAALNLGLAVTEADTKATILEALRTA